MRLLCAFLAAFIFIGNGASAKNVVFSDLFIFRMNNSVYSLDTLETYHTYLKDLKCFYPESIVVTAFPDLLSIRKGYFDINTYKENSSSSEYVRLTQMFITVLKMAKYASSQGVSVSSELPKAMKLSAQKNSCSLRGFDSKGLKDEMADIVLLEVFLRSRFMPKTSQELTKEQTRSVLKNIFSLSESVRSQVDHELFAN